MAEADQVMVAAGLGYARDGHALDVALGIGIFDDRDISSNQNPAYNGTYEFDSQLFAVSYAYTF
jgi:hypothetical protein